MYIFNYEYKINVEITNIFLYANNLEYIKLIEIRGYEISMILQTFI